MKYNRLTKRIANDEEAFLFHSSLHEGIERLAELEDKIEGREFIPAAEYESARHRAEVAERALKDMCEEYEDNFECDLYKECNSDKPCYLCDYKVRLQKAAREIEEEKGK